MDPQLRFTLLYQRHYGAVMRYATRRTDPDTARDVVAETFLVAWRRLEAVPDGAAEAEPWLYAVARRVLANAERSRRRAERVTARLGHQRPDAALAADPADAVTERARVEQALRAIPEADREALRLVGWEELDLAGAAIAMGCSRAAMAVRLHRARRRLARVLESREHGADTAPAMPAGSGHDHRFAVSREELP